MAGPALVLLDANATEVVSFCGGCEPWKIVRFVMVFIAINNKEDIVPKGLSIAPQSRDPVIQLQRPVVIKVDAVDPLRCAFWPHHLEVVFLRPRKSVDAVLVDGSLGVEGQGNRSWDEG